jgi:glycosyltransferase involved in cell wall biosynthesis
MRFCLLSMVDVNPFRALAVLVPVRDAVADIPEFLESATGLTETVIALDDGSKDASAEILVASPLVQKLIRKPRGQWDDRANRQTLLEAAAELAPQWILFLDADERIPPDDAAALTEFLHTDAIPGCAYGLQNYRSWGARYDPVFTWVFRLFAWQPDLVLPEGRLHFNPVPGSIAPERFIRTTIRIQHVGADSPERIEGRLRKYAQAQDTASHGGLDRPPTGELREWQPRAPELPVLAPPDPELAVLVPVRDGQGDLAGFLDSVANLTDTVIALDDGSEDASAELLAASPLIKRLIRRPRGPWNDAGNRQALLDAAAELRPRWLLFLDADERIAPDDAQALKDFLSTDAVPGFAYGLRVCRMIDDIEHFDRDGLLAWRLFAWEPRQRLPENRLHLVPVPEAIAPERRLPTTLRIQHLASLSAEQRQARHAKYLREDPLREFQPDYRHLLDEPGPLRRFEPRPPDQPVLEAPAGAADLEGPALSVIVIAREDTDRIEAAVEAVLAQDCPEPFEVIVVVSGAPSTAALVRARFPQVQLVELAQPVLPGAARNAGLRVARGEFVSFPGSHVQIAPGSLAARLSAHRAGAAMVTGSLANGTDTPAGWASYFIDHADALPGRPSGELSSAPVRCSYMRHHLEQLGGFPDDLRAGEDTVVNQELFRRGYRARRIQEIVLVHRSRCETVPRLVRHHFQRGRALGKILRAEAVPRHQRAKHAARYVPVRLRYIEAGVGLWGGELEPRYREVRRLVQAGVIAAWAGYVCELLSSAGR